MSEQHSARGPQPGPARPDASRPDAPTDCSQVLNEVYLYLDLECTEPRRERIRTHLDECTPCLREYGIEQEVKALVSRCCGSEAAPGELRARLRDKLTELARRSDLRHRLPE